MGTIEPYYVRFIAFPLAFSIILGFALQLFNGAFTAYLSEGAVNLLLLFVGVSIILIVLPVFLHKSKGIGKKR